MEHKFLRLCIISCGCLQTANECPVTHFRLGIGANNVQVHGLGQPSLSLLFRGVSNQRRDKHGKMQSKGISLLGQDLVANVGDRLEPSEEIVVASLLLGQLQSSSVEMDAFLDVVLVPFRGAHGLRHTIKVCLARLPNKKAVNVNLDLEVKCFCNLRNKVISWY